MFISHYNGHLIKLVRPLSTVDNTRDYARVSHSRQWSNYNMLLAECFPLELLIICAERKWTVEFIVEPVKIRDN